MKTNLRFLRLTMMLMLSASVTGLWAQVNKDPTQTVCIGTQNYYVVPGDEANVFQWSISTGVSETDWIIVNPTGFNTNINWLMSGPYTLTLTETSPTTCETIVSLAVTVNALPTIYTVSGGGSYCAGGLGVNISLSGSEVGATYVLWKDGFATGTSIIGTGSALSFTGVTAAGAYTVVVTNASTCVSTMTGSASVTVNPLPTTSPIWHN